MEELAQQKKRSLPPHITTPRKGPLLLSSSKPPAAHAQSCSNQKRRYVHPPLSHKKIHTQGLLTRYPVFLPPQPMDVIEGHLLNGLTWLQLKHNIQLMDGQGPAQTTSTSSVYETTKLPTIHSRMRYTPHSSHGNDPLLSVERYTHSMSSEGLGQGKMNISITCSRNQHQRLTPLTGQIHTPGMWRGPTLNSPIKEKEKPHTKPMTEEAASRQIASSDDGIQTEHHEMPSSSQPLPIALSVRTPNPSQPPRLYLSSHIGSSIAPPSVRAAATHRLRPITSNTMIKGKSLSVTR